MHFIKKKLLERQFSNSAHTTWESYEKKIIFIRQNSNNNKSILIIEKLVIMKSLRDCKQTHNF